MTRNNNRVCCLYRVSTDKQVDFNSNHEADLPMQRKACHKFAESKGWVIVHEEQEEGVSGHKVRAAARDKLQIIKDYARKGKFDILLVFMFDRIGRIADETPFVVEWFVRNGIRVWSTQEGEQRFDNHTDKLLNYIRFWQADGESEKTSVRTRTSLRQLVEEGHFKGGNAPYGYDLVRSGRINKRKHEIIDKAVRQIFSKMRGIPKEQIVTKRYEKENAERKNHLQDLQTQRNKAEKDLFALKTEVLACIKGESVLPRETLAEMITAQEEKLTELENLCEAASEELEKTAELMDKVSRLYDELISYADLYDSANFEAKKMIVNQLIRRVDVYRGYQINISFNFDLTPYIEGE